MAASPAPAAPAAPKKGPSLVVQAGLLLVTTAMAVGIGFAGAGFLSPAPAGTGADKPAAAGEPAEAAAGHGAPKGEKEEGGHGGGEAEKGEHAPALPGPAVVPLAPITANLAAPTDTWLRMELSLEFKDGADSHVVEAVQEDFLAYLRTVKLHQIDGPSGLVHLKADLNERAAIRSEGKVAQVFVRTMLFE